MSSGASSTRISAVYAITHLESGKAYVGASVNVGARFKHWRWALRGGYGAENKELLRDWQEYGEPAFRFELLETGVERDKLGERENHWIDALIKVYNVRRSYPGVWLRDGTLAEDES